MESYHSAGFAEVYAELVASLPTEFEAGADAELLAQLVEERLGAAAGPVRVLDACCGSGRIALDLRRRCGPAAVAAAARHGQHPALDLLGVDNSQEMLGAAQRATAGADAAEADAGGAPAPCRARWVLADVAALGGLPELAPWRGACDLAVVAAGSFHHLVSEAAQLGCLRGLAAMLAPGGLAVLDLLPPSALRADVGTPVQLGAFRRTCLLEQREAQPDGGVVWRQKFWLERWVGWGAWVVRGGTRACRLARACCSCCCLRWPGAATLKH